MPADLSRRELFRQLCSKQTARKLASFVSHGLGNLGGFGRDSAGSVEEAGRALRTMRRKRSQRFGGNVHSPYNGVRNADSGDLAFARGNCSLHEVNSRTCAKPGTEDSTVCDSNELQAPAPIKGPGPRSS